MGAEIIGLIGIGLLIVVLLTGIWVGVAMGLVGFLGFAYLVGFGPALKVLVTVPYSTLHSYGMSPIPLFVLMGVVIGSMGIGQELYKVANVWLGQFRGGLTHATTLACAALAAISGSSLPALVTMGKVAIPEMERYEYDIPVAAASIATAGTLGVLIPPSTGFILYSLLTNQSVAKLFMAGIVPGLLLTVLLLLTIAVIYWRHPELAPNTNRTTFREKVAALGLIWPVLLLFILVIGGMYGGIFTATEGGAVGAFGAILVSGLKGRLSVSGMTKCFLDAVKVTGMISILMVGGYLLMRFVTVSRLPFELAGFVQGIGLNRFVVFALIILMYLFLGMFMHVYGAVVLTVPILYPLILALNFDPIWFGVIVVMVIEIGLITPPIGLNVFTLCGITGLPNQAVFARIWPMVLAMLGCILLITIFPGLVLFLPNMM